MFVLAAVVVAGVAAQETFGATTTIEGVEEEGTKVKWEFHDSKGNTYTWSMPITTYEHEIVESRYHVRDKVNLNLDGETLRTVNLDGFVKRSFANVIDGIYDNSRSNTDFIWEVWYIVSQLTVYDKDVHPSSEGRYALETLTRGGGDCEDLVILVADMLMSSEHTDDWTFEYVFMDSKNPTDPQTMNHVILRVHDGEYRYYIEATGEPSWRYFPDGVTGWRFDVVEYTNELDFSGQDLRWMDLRQRDFSYAVLTDADLSGADLTSANLRWADLSGADLSGADLSFADLRNANLYGADLRNADLYGAYLEDADLSLANLHNADLRRAYLGNAILIQADLSAARLGWSNLFKADLNFADLGGANMWWADVRNATLVGADLSGANMRGTNLHSATLVSAEMSEVDLSYASLGYANLHDANLRHANLYGAHMWGADLSLADLYNANLYGVNLGEADLRGANLDEAANVDRVNWYGVLE